jgi:ligand-binding sensor domain-containing protein
MMGKALTRDVKGAWTHVDDQGQFAASEVVAFCETRAGQFWLGTRKALFRKEQDRWTAITTKDGLASSEVRALFEDREGNLWIGSGAGGLRPRSRDRRSPTAPFVGQRRVLYQRPLRLTHGIPNLGFR